MSEEFKFGALVRRKYSHTIGIATIVDDTHCYIAWPSGNSDWHEKDNLIPVPHPDTERLMYLVENKKVVLLDDDESWAVLDAKPEYYNEDKRLSREFDLRHAIDNAIEIEKNK